MHSGHWDGAGCRSKVGTKYLIPHPMFCQLSVLHAVLNPEGLPVLCVVQCSPVLSLLPTAWVPTLWPPFLTSLWRWKVSSGVDVLEQWSPPS